VIPPGKRYFFVLGAAIQPQFIMMVCMKANHFCIKEGAGPSSLIIIQAG
jgi:hypothetical protein